MDKGLQNLLLLAGAGVAIFAGWRVLAGEKDEDGPTPVPGGKRVVSLIGDSTIGGARLKGEIAERLVTGSKVHQFSYQGQETKVILGHVGEALAVRPTELVVLCGVNDVWNGRTTPEQTISNLEAIYAAGRAAGARVIAVQILPWYGYKGGISSGKKSATEVINMHIQVASSADNIVITEGLGDSSGRLLDDYASDTGLHLNALGQEALAGMIVKQAF
jgi:lysophospholipase L1-like esterase